MLQLPPNPTNLRLPLDWQINAALKMKLSVPKIGWREEDCETCNGTKVVRTWEGIPLDSDVVEFPCNCVEQVILSRYLGMRGINVKLRCRGFVDTHWVKKDVRESLAKWNNSPAALASATSGIVFTGMSKGKSLVASLLQRLLLLNNVDAYMVNAQMFIPDGALGNYKSESYEEIQEFWNKSISVAPVMVIDHLEGAVGLTDWGRARIASLIQQRRDNELMTVITTESLGSMALAIPDKSDVTEGFEIVEMKSDIHPTLEIDAKQLELGIRRPVVMS